MNRKCEVDFAEVAERDEARRIIELGAMIVYRSNINKLADGCFSNEYKLNFGSPKPSLMGDDPRLPKMPQKPTLIDFFKYRFGPSKMHLLQSARLAQKNGLSEKIVLACLLHDISVIGFFRPDHGYWGAAMLEPYVDEEISWAIRMHQPLRFFPDEELGYKYPDTYAKRFMNYQLPDFIKRDASNAKNHKWYISAMQICLNDLYSFDPDTIVDIMEFEDIIGRHFKQPVEGLGNDNTPASHIWRTLIRPSNTL